MKKNRIKLTKEAIDLVTTIKVRETDFNEGIAHYVAGIDANSVYGGSDLLEDVSMAIGVYDQRIAGTEENSCGITFADKELMDRMFDLHEFVMKHIVDIENLIHYWSNKGGLSEGTYNTITMQKEE